MPDLNEILGTLPSGAVVRLTDDEMTRSLRETYNTDAERARRKTAKQRIDFYQDAGYSYFCDDLRTLFKNTRVLEWRKALLPFALFQNFTKRVVHEVSTVYSQPASRTIRAANERYQEFQRAVRQDRRMRKVNRYLNLVNDLIVYPWVEESGRPRLDVVTPDKFAVIAHPNDPAQFVGAIIDRIPRGKPLPTAPHYMVCDAETWFYLDADWRMVPNSRKPHGRGRIPVILAQREPPDGALLDSTSGEDIISAHRALALLNVLLLKHQKSGTRVPYATGDTSNVARDQPMDDEHLIELGEGVALGSLDLGADPENYIKAGRAIIKQAAANHGIPESVFDLSYQATSGFEIELKRVGLKELREEQILDYRPLERDLADLQSRVMAGRPLAFNVDGWAIDFGDVAQPQAPLDRLSYWDKLEQLGLANRVEMYLTMNPELQLDEARAAVERNMDMYLDRVRLFQQAQGGPAADGTAEDGGEGNGVGMTLAERVDAVGVLIRAGFLPADALRALGLPPMRHLGLMPVTLKEEDAEGERAYDDEWPEPRGRGDQ